MFSHSQKLMISDIIVLAANNGFYFGCHVKNGFLQITFTKSGQTIYYDESEEKRYHSTRRHYFLKKIIKNLGIDTLYHNDK